MNRRSLAAKAGMVFLYPEAHRGGYWMKDTLIPLDIAFADARGKILRIFTMQPCRRDPCRIYDPEVAYRSRARGQRGLVPPLAGPGRRPDHRPGYSSGLTVSLSTSGRW